MTSRRWIVGALVGGGLIAAGAFLLLRDARLFAPRDEPAPSTERRSPQDERITPMPTSAPRGVEETVEEGAETAPSRSARLTPQQLEQILAACKSVTWETIEDLDLSNVDLKAILLEVARSGVTASALLGEIEALEAADARRAKLFIALAMAPGFGAVEATAVNRMFLGGLKTFDPKDAGEVTAVLAAAHCLRLQEAFAVDAALADAIRSFAPDPDETGRNWRDHRVRLIATMLLDGYGDGPVPAAAVELAGVLLDPSAWRLLTRGDNPAFAKAAGAFLGGEETGAVSALFSTQNPAHEGTLEQFLHGDFSKGLNSSLAGYALVGLLRINTPTSRQAAVRFLKGDITSRETAEGALALMVFDVDEYLDVETLPGLVSVAGELGPDAMAPAIKRVLDGREGANASDRGQLNGLGVTPARRRRVREDLLDVLRSSPSRDSARLALTALATLGTAEDLEAIETLAGRHDLVQEARDAAAQIADRTPGLAR